MSVCKATYFKVNIVYSTPDDDRVENIYSDSFHQVGLVRQAISYTYQMDTEFN